MPTREAAAERTRKLIEALGHEIARERKYRDMTQQDLADLTGGAVTKSQVGKIERGQYGQVLEVLTLAEVLDVKVSELMRQAERHIA